jgi:hypothetical protein
VVRQIEINVEPLEVAPVLLLDRVDLKVRNDKAALLVLGMRQRIEPLRVEVLVADLVRAHRRQALPGHTGGQFDAHAFLDRFRPVHRDTLGGAVAQVVTLVQHSAVLLFDARLLARQARHQGRKRLRYGHRHIARQPPWSLIETFGPHQVRVRGRRLGLCLGCGLLRIDVTECQDQSCRRENDPAQSRRSDHLVFPLCCIDWERFPSPVPAPLEIGKDPVSPLRVQCLEAVFEEALVIHAGAS